MKVIGVRFKSTKKIYYFNPNGYDVKKYDNVIVETSRGIEFGQAVIGVRDVEENEIVQPLQNVVRIATAEDERKVKENLEKQKEAFEKCQQKIEERKLDMKLVDAEYTFDGTKLIFYFTSEGRVDFRDLVKDLAVMFKIRIELRQIAVRDETKMLGGLGACGNEICCKRFLGDFASVSIKMAKEQNLSLNPTKISGLCGRLICCLNFEKSFYDEMNKKLPAVDETVMSPKGSAQVVATYPLKESVRVKYTNPDGSTDTAIFHLNEITRTHGTNNNSSNTVQTADDTNIKELEAQLGDSDLQSITTETVPTESKNQKPANEKRNNGNREQSERRQQPSAKKRNQQPQEQNRNNVKADDSSAEQKNQNNSAKKHHRHKNSGQDTQNQGSQQSAKQNNAEAEKHINSNPDNDSEVKNNVRRKHHRKKHNNNNKPSDKAQSENTSSSEQ